MTRRRQQRPGGRPLADPAAGAPLPPAWGWKNPDGGRAANVVAGAEFQATTTQCCGLNPFVTGAGAPLAGTPVGRDQLNGSVVCLDPLAWLRAGLVTNPGMFLLGEPGAGKALDVRTPVPTPGGWTTMEALRPGDYVFAADGQPATVLAVSEIMTGRPCLDIRFGDETAITADVGHLWVTTTRTAACVSGGAPGTAHPGTAQAGTAIRTTRQIMDTLTGPAGEPAHRITAAQPLQLPDARLPVPPYLLGAWLAGGARSIPGRYLRASAWQRRALLDSLLAAAGAAARHGQVAYVTSNGHLARDVRELACTLGHPALLRRLPAPGGAMYTVLIPAGAEPGWQVVSVRPAASRPVRCIQVASQDGLFLAGETMVPTHNSTLAKRLVTGAVARGDTVLVLGDPRPDYTALTERLGGQVIRLGRGLAKVNPLDAGPLGAVLPRLPAAQARQARDEVRARRLSLLMAECTLIRGRPIGNAEEVILGKAVDLLDERTPSMVTVPDVLRIIEEGPDQLRGAARAPDPDRYRAQVSELIFTLDLLLTGTLRGVFDGPTTTPIDMTAPIVSVDISRAGGAGDKLLTAAMLCTWAYGFAVADATALMSGLGLTAPRSYMAVMDEMWRSLRAPGLVEHADALTRLNRAMGMASIMITHSLADLDSLATEEDRAKARGFIDRSAIKVLAALPPRELAQVSQITPLTGPEQELVASWSAPDSWQPGARHPGRGKYLVKTGGRLGIAFEVSLVGEEPGLYDTDQAIRADAPPLRTRPAGHLPTGSTASREIRAGGV